MFVLGPPYSQVVKPRALLRRIAQGSVRNVSFQDTARLLQTLGFEQKRTTGSHHIYAHPGVPELLNLQEVGGQAKPYQLRQLLKLVERYSLKIEEDE